MKGFLHLCAIMSESHLLEFYVQTDFLNNFLKFIYLLERERETERDRERQRERDRERERQREKQRT